MILSDRDIKRALKTGRIQIKPRPVLKTQLGSCSIDLRLGRKFGILNHSKFAFVDPRNPKPVKEYLEGKDQAIMFLVGQVMKKSKGKANPQVAREILKRRIEK